MEYYDLQNTILKEAARPSSEKSGLSIKEPAAKYAASRSAADTSTLINDMKLQQSEKQFLTNLMNAKEQLKTFAKQNNIATIIAAANIPITLAGSVQQMNRADEQDKTNRQIMDIYQANADKAMSAAKAEQATNEDFLASRTGRPVGRGIVNLRDIVSQHQPSNVPYYLARP